MKHLIRSSAMLLLFIITLSAFAQERSNGVKLEEISIACGDALYSGTLSIPAAEGVYPLVILVSGMGPQDRDWSFAGGKYKMAAIIADYLNMHGIAVFRYDDRGFKKSTGTAEGLLSFKDLSEDIQKFVGQFRVRKEIGKIGLCGHSLGGILSVISAANNKDIDFIITLSGSFRNGADIMTEQATTLKRWRTSENMTDDEVIANGVNFVQNLVSYSKDGKGEESIRETLNNLITYQISKLTPEKMAENLKVYKDKEEMHKKNLDEAFAFYTSPHQRSFITYNASDDFQKISCPVLVMFGDLDKNVVVSSNLPPVVKGLIGSKISDFTLRIISGADHGYSSSELVKKGEMIPGTLEYISNWILTRR